MSNSNGQPAAEFLITKEYRRFAEFCDAVRREHYIGVCHGVAGVGKTLSARHYSRWDAIGTGIDQYQTIQPYPAQEVVACRTLFYTPSVMLTPKRLAQEVGSLYYGFNIAVDRAVLELKEPGVVVTYNRMPDRVELVIVDEADRLKYLTLEELRDLYDRGRYGLILIGMPGLEKRLARFPQLYSRIGFVHQYQALSVEELRFILEHKWAQLGLSLSPDDFTDAEAMAAIARITGGNFRLVQRLFTQVERILRINELHSVTKEVVEAARDTLLIGPA